MRVQIPSERVEDQTSDEWADNNDLCSKLPQPGHSMVSIKTGSTGVPYVERCRTCGWIDPVALEFHVENAIKINATKRSQRIAIAAETDPFQFVQSSSEDLDLVEILTQALAAAHLEGINRGRDVGYSRKLTQILSATKAEMQRMMALDHERRSHADSAG